MLDLGGGTFKCKLNILIKLSLFQEKSELGRAFVTGLLGLTLLD